MESHLSLLERVVHSAEKLCEGVNFVVWGIGGPVPCVCSARFIKEQTTVCTSISILLLKLVILEL